MEAYYFFLLMHVFDLLAKDSLTQTVVFGPEDIKKQK